MLVALGKRAVVDFLFMAERGSFQVIGKDGLQRNGMWERFPAWGETAVRLSIGQIDITFRQLEVLAGVGKGLTYKQVGEVLGIAAETVSGTIRNAERKNGVTVKVELDRFGMLGESFVTNLSQGLQEGIEVIVFDSESAK